ncbi:hypothetical protein COHA_005257 [Chlorella ohadii]|uniref:Uncharacterized protein n=1 Tax=Chlorella ohadii TaxID=2649997 RepID=A0AAD5DRD0_9CHLO|nr:hypothetical protein COHA_005257 [Chlorella ohadii]
MPTAAGLHSEQRALLDLLVLPRADKFVGTKRSAFSYMARELRQLGGKSTASTRLHPAETLQYDVVLEISRES